MKQEDRDLLARIDERTNNIWYVVEKMEKGQAVQNGSLLELFERSATNEADIVNANNRIGTIWRVGGWIGGSLFGGGTIAAIVCRALGVF